MISVRSDCPTNHHSSIDLYSMLHQGMNKPTNHDPTWRSYFCPAALKQPNSQIPVASNGTKGWKKPTLRSLGFLREILGCEGNERLPDVDFRPNVCRVPGLVIRWSGGRIYLIWIL